MKKFIIKNYLAKIYINFCKCRQENFTEGVRGWGFKSHFVNVKFNQLQYSIYKNRKETTCYRNFSFPFVVVKEE